MFQISFLAIAFWALFGLFCLREKLGIGLFRGCCLVDLFNVDEFAFY